MLAEQKAGGYSTKYRFTGKEVDEETGLYYFGARYYDSRISLWYGVDPMAEKAPSWNPFRYCGNNPIRHIDPNGMFESEEEAKANAKNNGIKTGWFRDNKIQKNNAGSNTWSINNKKEGSSITNYGGETGVQKVATIFGKPSWHKQLFRATENFFGVKEQDLRGEGGKEAVMKIAGKEASIILNIFSFGEGIVALNFKKGASALGIGIGLFGVANDANDLGSDLFGFNTFEKLMGEGKSDITKGINGILGLSSSIKANLKTAFP